jgi:hypothetical protein
VDPDQSINLQGAAVGSISGIVATSSSNDTSYQPVYLLLVDDNKGSSSTVNPGAYAAQLMVLRHGTFHKLTAPNGEEATSTTNAGGMGSSNRRFEEQSTKTSPAASISLPRMNCATYHPNTGYVYASGTGVFSLSCTNVKAVLNGVASSQEATRGFGKYAMSSSSRIRQSENDPDTEIYPVESSLLSLRDMHSLPEERRIPITHRVPRM